MDPVAIDDYKEAVSYDPNGNIVTYDRNGSAARVSMDNLAYSYKPTTNQLDKVTDGATDAISSEYDKYSDIKQGQSNGNYGYDAIGNLISDASEGITGIDWSVYGKILNINKGSGNIHYSYDAAGNRISKTVGSKTTIYVRDATGNVMSVYESVSNGMPVQKENHLYGSSRLGIQTELTLAPSDIALSNNFGTAKLSTFSRGEKFFELNNHLGNVLATISDKKLQHSTDNITVDYYHGDVIIANDYAPFGALLPGRKYAQVNANYRYGFNGKELDKEISNTTTYDYGFRIYSPALGRFLLLRGRCPHRPLLCK